MKQSIKQYRNINGKYYYMETANPSEFEVCKKECKKENISFRIINDQFYKERKVYNCIHKDFQEKYEKENNCCDNCKRPIK